MKKLFFSILTGILMLTASHKAEAVVITTINPLQTIIASTAFLGAAGTMLYSAYHGLAATYYSTFRHEETPEEELYNNRECRQHQRKTFLSYLTAGGLSFIATLASMPSISYISR